MYVRTYVACEEVVNKLIKYAGIFNVSFKWCASNAIKGSKLSDHCVSVLQYDVIFVDNHLGS